MPLDPTLRDQLAKTIHDAACACGGRTHHRHYLTAADKATELLTTQPAPIVLPTAKEVREAIIAGTKLGGWMPHTAAQAALNLIASRVRHWVPVEPGTLIKKGTHVRHENAVRACAGEYIAVSDFHTYEGDRYYIDPATVPAPEDPRLAVVVEWGSEPAAATREEAARDLLARLDALEAARDLLARLDALEADR